MVFPFNLVPCFSSKFNLFRVVNLRGRSREKVPIIFLPSFFAEDTVKNLILSSNLQLQFLKPVVSVAHVQGHLIAGSPLLRAARWGRFYQHKLNRRFP
jgi:hypothetical protein